MEKNVQSTSVCNASTDVYWQKAEQLTDLFWVYLNPLQQMPFAGLNLFSSVIQNGHVWLIQLHKCYDNEYLMFKFNGRNNPEFWAICKSHIRDARQDLDEQIF